MEQAKELAKLKIWQETDQFLFTYTNNRNMVNQPVYPTYLNEQLNTIHDRHPQLRKTHPHALRHTLTTIAKMGNASLEELTHQLSHKSNRTTTIYDDSIPRVPDTIPKIFMNQLKKAREQAENDEKNA